MPEQRRPGKTPTKVWINGQEFSSICVAYAEIGANTNMAKRRAREAMESGEVFENAHCERFRLSLAPPPTDYLEASRQPPHVFGEPLIKSPATHRLGYTEA